MEATTLRLCWRMLGGLLLWLAPAGLGGCDDNHDGTVSSGPELSPARSVVAKRKGRVRLIYGPGGPLSSARVAGVIRKRLASLGIPEKDIRIGGEQIHVDVPKDKVAAAKEALNGGRLEIYRFDDQADPFAQKTAEHAKRYTVKSESMATTAGARTLHYLVAPADQREQLLGYLSEHTTGAKGLVGPVYAGADTPTGLRSYFVQPSQPVRGELVRAAAAKETKGRVTLTLELEGQGKASVSWESKQRARFVLLMDGLVVATLQPASPVRDGKLAFPVADRGGPEATLAVAAALAKQVDGIAFSHQVTLDKERPLDAPR